MKEEAEYIIAAVALLAAGALLSFGFSGTGFFSKDLSSTSVGVSPEVVSPGEYININVNTNGRVHDRFTICQANNLCVTSGSMDCTGYACTGELNVEYRLPSNLQSGSHYVKIKDLSSGKEEKAYFDIE